jgi:hypothetical protein
MTRQEIAHATREELQEYLEGWGYGVYETEPTEDLRTAALENLETEGE